MYTHIDEFVDVIITLPLQNDWGIQSDGTSKSLVLLPFIWLTLSIAMFTIISL